MYERREYKGHIFKRDLNSKHPSKKLFFQRRSYRGTELLHRLIYQDHYGSIPEDCYIVFIDGDHNNLNPSNLKAISALEFGKWINRNKHLRKCPTKYCKNCGEPFPAKQKRSKYCITCATLTNYGQKKIKDMGSGDCP